MPRGDRVVHQPRRRDAFACTIYHGDALDLAAFGAMAKDASSWRAVNHLLTNDLAAKDPAVVLVDKSMLPRIDQLRRLPRHVVLVAADDESENALHPRTLLSVAGAELPVVRKKLLVAACELSR